MKITVTTASQTLAQIMWNDITKLSSHRQPKDFKINIQNLSVHDIYLENWETATVSNWYKLYAGSEVEIVTTNLLTLNLIADWWTASDVRIIAS